MTGREKLDRRKRRMMGVMYAGIALGMGGIALGGTANAVPAVLFFSGIGVLFVGALSTFVLGLPCPWCRSNLWFIGYPGFSIDRRVRFCPYCGKELDDELPEELSEVAATGGDDPS